MAEQTKRIYGGQTADQRRAERRSRLLDAGLDVIGTEGWSNTTVRGVCQRARLSPRFFYESFTDLDTLAVAVFDEINASVLPPALAAMHAAADDPHARIRAAIETLLEHLTSDPRRARVAFAEALGSEPLMKRRLATMQTISGIIAAEIRRAHSLPAEDSFVDVAANGLAAAITELGVVWVTGDLVRTREQLTDDIVDLVIANIDSAAAIIHRRTTRSRP